jgi:tRNA(Leu) C34 or U34 (ribose-2'-O)-methylase TrmL
LRAETQRFIFGTRKRQFIGRNFSADGFSKKIPMVGFTESLNISVSAAIIIQNLTDRLHSQTLIGTYPKIFWKSV